MLHFNLGNICLCSALLISLIAAANLFISNSSATIYKATSLQFLLLTMALLNLLSAYINTNFTFANVLQNSHPLLPIMYKITSLWANHEGSMLLWLWLFSLSSVIFMNKSSFSVQDTAEILAVQSWVAVLFLLFSIFVANPFVISKEIFPVGQGFNPLLQDVGLYIHPPILYAGYTGLSLSFSASLLALMRSRYSSIWFNKLLYPWITVPWALLTLGIGLGGWWAYRELGWGGFWFWDPVENISLIVWLFATALIHMMKISIKQSYMYRGAIILGITSFLSSIFGMFLVRSGILSSVHSFALDISSGIFLFIIFIILLLISVFLFIKSPSHASQSHKFFFAKNVLFKKLVSSVIFLCIISVIIILGILYPLVYQYIYGKIVSISEAYYVKTISIIFIPSILLLAIYTAGSIKELLLAASFSIFLTLAANFYHKLSLLPLLYLLISLLFIFSLAISVTAKLKQKQRSAIVMHLGHLGLVILLLGGSFYYAWGFSASSLMSINEKILIKEFNLQLKQVSYGKKDNYLYRRAHIDLERSNKAVGTLLPELRFYPIEKNFTYESSILHTISGDIYLTIGAVDGNNKIIVEIQYKPFIYLIWLGVLLMSSSSLVCCINRKNKK